MNKVELLAPAGSLDRAILALDYGADAVYVGGKKFSLRARASNFEIEDIRNLCLYAKTLNKKVYVTTNIIPHDNDLDGLDEYLIALESSGVTGIITSSLSIIKRAEEVAPKLERHVSTQMSITNGSTIKFFSSLGVKRVVLARENSMDEIKRIMKETPLEIEAFIHGGMCSSYSGRCVLSNHYTLRDANRGGCAHSCRWNYHLYDGKKRLNEHKRFFNVGSKDLNAGAYIEELIKAGVASLKIEGRMKSAYYLATVVKAYRMLIDHYYEKCSIDKKTLEEFNIEIRKAENRDTGIGFYNGITTINEQLYDQRTEEPTKEFVGYVLSYNDETHEALIEQRNYFIPGDTLEAFGPHLNNSRFIVGEIIDFETKEVLDAARHPLQKLIIKTDIKLKEKDMLRKVFK